MPDERAWTRRASRLLALACLVVTFNAARLPEVASDERTALAARFRLVALPVAEPDGYRHETIRQVNPAYEHIKAWISSVGASIAMADLDGGGRPDDLCYVDTRINETVVAPAPVAPAAYQPFVLVPEPLPYDRRTMAPMGCLPGDFDEDGRIDLLVYFWGRTPIVYLATAGSPNRQSADAYRAVELVSSPPGVSYQGPRWYTNAATRADLDGDGHVDLVIGNYFPEGTHVLDASGPEDVAMQDSMSRAVNGGKNYLLRWSGADPLTFTPIDDVLADEVANGWTLAAGAADLDGDLLPELYLANDFGPDRLLHNTSTPRGVTFRLLHGERHLTTPGSKVLGRDSFKGMGVDFGDLNGDAMPDLFVSNITTEYGLQESNFVWMSTGDVLRMGDGVAPYDDASESLGLSRSGWGWDARLADLDNDGAAEILQATGFVKGDVNRWPELQELAMGNDALLRYPGVWPRFQAGDDLSGTGTVGLWVRAADGRYTNVGGPAGFDQSALARGLALGDADGDGDLDVAVANQWGAPVFYRNDCPTCGSSLSLRLLRRGKTQGTANGSPAIGATASLHLGNGRALTSQVDGGNGHSGKRSPDVVFGLGSHPGGLLPVELRWRDARGVPRQERLWLPSGRHTVVLDETARQVR